MTYRLLLFGGNSNKPSSKSNKVKGSIPVVEKGQRIDLSRVSAYKIDDIALQYVRSELKKAGIKGLGLSPEGKAKRAEARSYIWDAYKKANPSGFAKHEELVKERDARDDFLGHFLRLPQNDVVNVLAKRAVGGVGDSSLKHASEISIDRGETTSSVMNFIREQASSRGYNLVSTGRTLPNGKGDVMDVYKLKKKR